MADPLGQVAGAFSQEALSSTLGRISSSIHDNDIDAIYTVRPENWFKAKPYGFVSWDRTAKQGGTSVVGKTTFWLPIAPQNINVTTHFATNIVTTLYGVVEEHSEVRYYDINISGTTGYGPRYFDHTDNSSDDYKSGGRASFDNSPIFDIPTPGGIGAGALGALNQAASATKALFVGDPPTETGVDINKSGYMAFHRFYRFLLRYKKDAAGLLESTGLFKERNPNQHPLQFLNYKDNIRYDCIPVTFTLTRSNENPMLYNYNIKLRAFNLRGLNDNPEDSNFQDNFLKNLGLKGGGDDVLTDIAGSIGGAVRSVSGLF